MLSSFEIGLKSVSGSIARRAHCSASNSLGLASKRSHSTHSGSCSVDHHHHHHDITGSPHVRIADEKKVVEDMLLQLQETPPSCPCHQHLDSVFFNRQSINLNGATKSSSHKIISAPGSIAHSFQPVDRVAFEKQMMPSPALSGKRMSEYLNRRDARRFATNAQSADVDYAFEMATSNVRYGWGVTREVGWDLVDLQARRVAIFTDKNLRKTNSFKTVIESLEAAKKERIASGINDSILSSIVVFDEVECEPTDSSFKRAIDFAVQGGFDAFVALGGGSVIDTCKAANLYSTYPPENGDFLTYVNPPIGKGVPVPGPLKPLIAIPTTAGTGSETTGVAIFDLVEMNAKTGIAHRRLKPTLGIVDPENTRTLPFQVAVASGFDVLCHSLESYTAIPFDKRSPRPPRPLVRPAYQGANPISDIWCLKALDAVAKYLPRAAKNGPDDDVARAEVILAATYAGIGFGNAGVHLCHAMSYPVSGNVKSWRSEGYYGSDEPLIPHGVSVVTHAPAVFRFTSIADPERHVRVAQIMNAARNGDKVAANYTRKEDAGKYLADEVIAMMQDLEIPNGLKAMGYEKEDIPKLVEGTLPQHRVTKLSPRPVGANELHHLFEDSMVIW